MAPKNQFCTCLLIGHHLQSRTSFNSKMGWFTILMSFYIILFTLNCKILILFTFLKYLLSNVINNFCMTKYLNMYVDDHLVASISSFLL